MLICKNTEMYAPSSSFLRFRRFRLIVALIGYSKLVSVSLIVTAAMLTASMATLFVVTVHAQASVPERLAAIENTLHYNTVDNDRLMNEIMMLQSQILVDREKLAIQDSRISTVIGFGLGLGSIVMVLQIFSMLMGYGRKIAEDKNE